MNELKQDRCPLCGGPNDCGMASREERVLVREAADFARVLKKVPEVAKRKVCMCAKCVQASRLPIRSS